MTSPYAYLTRPQKGLIFGIIGSCTSIFLLNAARLDLESRRRKDLQRLVEARQISPNQEFTTKDGGILIPPALRNARPSFAESPFLEDIWTPRFMGEQLILSRENWAAGRWWTMLTYGFSHGSPSHLMVNMLAFHGTAPALLATVGTPAFLAVWLAGGIAGGCFGLVHSGFRAAEVIQDAQANNQAVDARELAKWQNAGYVGASASLFAVLAAETILNPRAQFQFMFIPYGIPAPTVLGISFVGSLAASWFEWLPGIGHWGHLGGMIAGLVVGDLIKRRQFGPRGGAMFVVCVASGLKEKLEYVRTTPENDSKEV